MSITNFPFGVSSFGVPLLGSGGQEGVLTTGSFYFVHSGIGQDTAPGNGAGQDPTTPFKTIAYAITWAVASKGDVIYVMPGHTETIAAAGTLALNKIGLRVIGLGIGSLRPVISFAGTDSIIAISAASVGLQNVILKAAIDEVVTAISVTAAFCQLLQVDVVETAAKEFIQFCLTTAAATDLLIKGCVHHQSTASASNSLWIQLVGADRARIEDNEFLITTTNSASSSVIESDTTAPVNIVIARNLIVQLGGTSTIPINLMAGTSGYAYFNGVASQKTAIAGSIALASCYGAQNWASHVVNKNGLLEPVVDA